MTDDSFLRLQARTARFTLGRPRGFTVSPDGARVLFLRSRGGTDRVTCLWSYEVASGAEALLADPIELLTTGLDSLPDAERARRERAREQAAGIVGYSTDAAFTRACFALSGHLFVVDVATGNARELSADGLVFDPHIDPGGRAVAFATRGTLRVVNVDVDGSDRELIAEPGVTWGLAEFVAAEEMGRQRGFWWAPDGSALLAARVDESGVQEWHIGDPSNPGRAPHAIRYPAAGTANAVVSLSLLHLDGRRTDVSWDADAFPYLVSVRWRRGSPPLLQLASRDQRTMRIADVDVETGATILVREDTDPHWLEVIPGVPDRRPDGQLVCTVDADDTRRLMVGDQVVSPVGLQVRAVLASHGDVLFNASTEPTEQHLWGYFADGECTSLTTEPGVHSGTGANDVLVVVSASLSNDGAQTVVRKNGLEVGRIASFAEPAPFSPRVSISEQGRRELRTALVLPRDHVEGSSRLPVLMDPYGGPHAQRVVASRGAYLNSQWLADQGFAVVIVDGRGTPARGLAWERAVAGDLATVVLEDQVDALRSLAKTHPDLDLSKVAIRGWSFGGYLAALAVLRRPDVFHAAIAGAPCIDWSLYDTHYTERYLGVDTSAPSYATSSLLADAPTLSRPLMIVHGLADDNVVAAHSLRLSTALLAAGRPHTLLPLSGVTHMASQEDVAANLAKLEVQFIRSSLGLAEVASPG
ncbi:MAG TPA: prolyl oligopeptidase family serine peptidase [Acidothermaceae bacterium]